MSKLLMRMGCRSLLGMPILGKNRLSKPPQENLLPFPLPMLIIFVSKGSRFKGEMLGSPLAVFGFKIVEISKLKIIILSLLVRPMLFVVMWQFREALMLFFPAM